MGGLIGIGLIVVGVKVWVGMRLKKKRGEVGEIEENMEERGVEGEGVGKVKIGKKEDGRVWIEGKEKRKGEVGN